MIEVHFLGNQTPTDENIYVYIIKENDYKQPFPASLI